MKTKLNPPRYQPIIVDTEEFENLLELFDVCDVKIDGGKENE
jgi:hypothetical protein